MSRPGERNPRWSPDQRSAWWFDKFAATSVHLVAGAFGGVRVLDPPPALPADRPLILASNHPSWWDPMVGLVSLLRYLPDRVPFVPIDPKGYHQHPIFARVGFFPVEPASREGALALLREGKRALETPGGLVWITPEGRFVDPRIRPLQLHLGVASLACRTPNALIVPVAIEYRFGPEPRPEALLSYGEPIDPAGDPPEHVLERLRLALTTTMDRLAEAIQRDDLSGATLILSGHTGTLNGMLRLLRAYARGPHAYDAVHLEGSD